MDDSAAIIEVLEKESATWRSGDFEGHAACWHIQPYSKILVSTVDGSTYDVPPEAMHDPKQAMGNGGFSVNSDYKMSIKGDFAWVSHKEVSTDTAGVETLSKELRILEKIEGAWKLVGQSIHQYKE